MKLIFLIDGFNLYHSILEAENKVNKSLKWLDLDKLCRGQLHNFGKEAKLEEIYYFSAHATHRLASDPNVINRHSIYTQALKEKQIKIELGRFKSKQLKCHHCKKKFTKFEEKETDVAIAVKLIELLHLKKADHIVLVSGDTDMVPAVKTANRLFGKKVSVMLPYRRHNTAYKNITIKQIKLKAETYSTCLFPEPFILRSGKHLSKPKSWVK